MLLLAASMPMLYGILRRLFPETPRMSATCAVGIALGMGLHHKYTYRFNEWIGVEVRLAEQIGQADAGAPITCLYGGGITYIDVIQFQLTDREISVVPEEMLGIAIREGRPVAQRVPILWCMTGVSKEMGLYVQYKNIM